ncbi:MAG: pyruvate formate-lyase [Ruminococcaceae bacterium]|nr:pyruvate formate-lyase [Oscillospiraceae bacterium]
MTDKIRLMLIQLKEKSYRALRTTTLDDPILYPVEYFGFHFGVTEKFLHSDGNIIPNYARVITRGLDATRREIAVSVAAEKSEEKRAFGEQMIAEIDDLLRICDSHREKIAASGNKRLYEALLRVPHDGAESFFEACLFLQICIYGLRRTGVEHLCLGRFDQYMYPFFDADLSRGVSEEELFETLEAFFVTLNYDTDLYHGIQQGDNGQSLVLGGFDADGNDRFNALSQMCMEASLELSLIDPKINLRVGKNTPDARYEFATRLTKKGLGFPQYCNDDVVIPGLIKLGYEPQDAYNYGVAACWEYIIPNCSAEVSNIKTMNFPLVVNRAVHRHLLHCPDFDGLMDCVEREIDDECASLVEQAQKKCFRVQPLLSVFVDGCIERLTNLWHGGSKYNNFGFHGLGIANAADALTAIKALVYDEKSLSPEVLLSALDANFEGYEDLRVRLKNCPKMGNGDDYADDVASRMMSYYSKHMNGRDNRNGGICRAGTGSAMFYVEKAKSCPATADGRLAGEPFSCSFSPSIGVRTDGILSVIRSFTKYDMSEIINGGPLTLEIHDTVLRNEVGIQKTAQLVKLFVLRGGHQLQLNSLDPERLRDAQRHPECYPNLIVRVWGWSGYFNELDLDYQNHIISRTAYGA